MAYYYGDQYAPYALPEPWRTTYVPHHFPEKHYPMEHFRHAAGHALGSVADSFIHPFGPEQQIYNPLADVRESNNNYYIDVELPGLESKENLKIKWLNARTFLVQTKIERPKIEVDELAGKETSDSAAAAGLNQQVKELSDGDKKDDSTIDEKDHEMGKNFVLTVHERRIGLLVRAFSFPTEVSHEMLEARLHAGLLRIKAPKKETETVRPEHKEVEVKHLGT